MADHGPDEGMTRDGRKRINRMRRVVKTETILEVSDITALSQEERELLSLKPAKPEASRAATRGLGYSSS